jgi:hypothetical protein
MDTDPEGADNVSPNLCDVRLPVIPTAGKEG